MAADRSLYRGIGRGEQGDTMNKIQGALLCALAGAVTASAGLSVARDWQAWALIILVALNGVRLNGTKPKRTP